MNASARRLRTPEERVGGLPKASLPPPQVEPGPDEVNGMLAAALRGDEKMFSEVIDVLYPPMLRLAQAHVRERAAAEEVVQESWLAALQGVHAFEGRSSLKTWLFRILLNIARRRGRRDARMVSLEGLQQNGDHDAADGVALVTAAVGSGNADRGALWTKGTDPEQLLLSAELGERIDAEIAALPTRLRQVLVLRDVEGWDAAEVCNTLGISDTNQRVILHRARDRVRDGLRGYLDDDGCGDDADNAMR